MLKKTFTIFALVLFVSAIGYDLPQNAKADTAASSTVIINPLNGGVASSSVVSSSPINPSNGDTAVSATSSIMIHSHPMNPLTAITSNLSIGMTSINVMLLQQYLNAQGYTVTTTGPGSSGQETQYFGPATRAALIKFQAANGIRPASGYFGPITRAYIAQKIVASNSQGDQTVNVVYQGTYTCLPHIPNATGAITSDCALGLETSGGLYYALDFSNNAALATSIQGATQISVTGTLESNAQNPTLSQSFAIQGIVLVSTVSKF